MTDLGTLLTGGSVNLGDTVQGSFTYDSDLGSTDSVSLFSISIGSSFIASLAGNSSFFVTNDSGIPPNDRALLGGDFVSTPLNGNTTGAMQFGLFRNNVDGQLWNDTLLPDLADWTNITLADMNNSLQWMDFRLAGTTVFSDDQIRWDVRSFSVADVSQVPEPSILALLALGLTCVGFAGRKTA
ncbi:MAG TPA: PEP-CTERM sorting domain-containing protein [Candidatus Tenderia electrophaga]|uniref:PEP-CTERM sorting domain-containing protein n=1 Tax=Candidatus Tenderia electrophaga TaxID=1748243 RepID=A0A832N2L1_9GAMM|nr:PEP-CTERM sorting domain-containing protein [Candidatus Tenderia electrophaga]